MASARARFTAWARVSPPSRSGSVPNTRSRTSSGAERAATAATRSGWRGASGAITSSAVVSRGRRAHSMASASTCSRSAS